MSVTTLNRLLDDCLERHPRNDLFSRKKRDGAYEDISTEGFARRVRYLGLGLADLGLKPGDRIAILSENRLEWAIADLAILSIGGVNVPIYPSLPPSQVRYLLEDSGARAIVVSNGGQLDKVREISGCLPENSTAITMDSLDVRQVGHIPVTCFNALYDRGRRAFKKDPSLLLSLSREIRADDVATIIYTSGTTGPPKGVLLTHQNILSNIQAVLQCIPVDATDRALSFLPLSHILERMAGYYAIMHAGGAIAFAGGIDTVPEDMVLTSPTLMITVPRFLEKMHESILSSMGGLSFLGRWAFDRSLRAGYRHLDDVQRRPGGLVKTPVALRAANSLVFSRLKKALGGRLRFFICGGAPLPLEVARFFHAVGVPVYEGYGLTETSPVVSCNTPRDWRLGSIGRPIPGVDVKTSPSGEILVRGPGVMLGYLGRDAETKQALADRWFHTGDIGKFDDDGFLYITDRKKDIIVTSGGKKVAPQPIETLLRRSAFIKEVVLIGNNRKYITALIVPDTGRMSAVVDRIDPSSLDPRAVIDDPEMRQIVEAEIEERCRDLAPYEQIRKFRLISREFRIGTEELTPTLKVRRHEVESRYRDIIDGMYE